MEDKKQSLQEGFIGGRISFIIITFDKDDVANYEIPLSSKNPIFTEESKSFSFETIRIKHPSPCYSIIDE